jgi:hypothetical protein
VAFEFEKYPLSPPCCTRTKDRCNHTDDDENENSNQTVGSSDGFKHWHDVLGEKWRQYRMVQSKWYLPRFPDGKKSLTQTGRKGL